MSARRTAAFLGGINLGKRRVKMDELRRLFEALGLEGVRTFIASGNVVFDDAGTDPSRLEADIERHLEDGLGFATTVFVRPLRRLAEIVAGAAVERALEEGFKPHVIFLREVPGPDVARALGHWRRVTIGSSCSSARSCGSGAAASRIRRSGGASWPRRSAASPPRCAI